MHRSEIDGLRAVAVIPVVLFHAGVPLLPGGYIGVDVFFVISGYLITSITLDGIARGTFTFGEFYERRARRILPALVFMLALTTVAAWFWLLPSAFRHFGISAAAVALFASNLYFLRTTDYFAAPTELVPLVHTWSLGVEEQFYLVFPILAVLLAVRQRAIIVIVVLILVSLGLAQGTATAHPAAGFYLLPTRAWELLAGSLVAYGAPSLSAVRRDRKDLLALGGFVALAGSYLIYDRDTPFPSLYAALPVAGAALVIAFGTAETRVGRLLSWPPLVFIGLISYSTYLWHQPLFAFARHMSLEEPPAIVFALLALAAFGMGAASWRLIERPFRDRAWLTRRQVFSGAGICSVLVLAFGVACHLTHGMRSRFSQELLAITEPEATWSRDPCHRTGFQVSDLFTSCVLGDKSNIIGALIGDSHAAAVAQGLGSALSEQGVGLLQLTLNGCPPIEDVYRADMGLAHACAAFNREVAKFLEARQSLQHVVVVSRWTRFIMPAGFDNGEGGVEHTRDRIEHLDNGRPTVLPEVERVALITRKTQAGIRRLLDHGKTVVLMYPIPEVGWEAPSYLARRALHRMLLSADNGIPSTSFARFAERNRDTFEMLDRIGAHARLARIYPHKAFCNTVLPGRCVFQDGNQSLYTDHNHVSQAGARLIAPDIAHALTREAQPP